MTSGPLTSAEIKVLLETSKNVAIVGVSDKADRASYQVAKWLQENAHFNLYFVNPATEFVLGQETFSSLEDVPARIDIVDVFRRAEDCGPVLEQAIKVGASSIWLQLGISSEEIATNGVLAGLQVVMDRCIKVDYAALVSR
jgi:predicted CoA-binding protein